MSFHLHILKAGESLASAVNCADLNNLARIASSFVMNPDKFREFAVWAYNDIPSGMMKYAYACLMLAYNPEEIYKKFQEGTLKDL